MIYEAIIQRLANPLTRIVPSRLVKWVRIKLIRREKTEIKRPILLVTLDACRYDTFKEVYEQGDLPGELYKAYSHATWTAPSHISMIRGVFPFSEEINVKEEIKNDYPHKVYPLPDAHKKSFAVTTMAPLSGNGLIQSDLKRFFQDYKHFMGEDKKKVTAEAEKYLEKYSDSNFFGSLNYGETHFAYPGLEHLTFDEFREKIDSGELSPEIIRSYQEAAAEQLLAEIQGLRKHIPEGTRVILTSDHGELFGEEGGLSHGSSGEEVFHRKLFEVPFITWVEGIE
ncbi:MAG: sulfatase-like hydrolase/transferase [Candidatus Nanohaloarchaea archaeon]